MIDERGALSPEARATTTSNAPLAAGASDGTDGAEEYVSITVLCTRIPYAPQTIRNLMSKGVLRRDVHYFKPRGRVIFKLSAVRAWIEAQRQS